MTKATEFALIYSSDSTSPVQSGVSHVKTRIYIKQDAHATPYLVSWKGRVRRVWRIWRHSEESGSHEHLFLRNRAGVEIAHVIVNLIPLWVRYPSDRETDAARAWIAAN